MVRRPSRPPQAPQNTTHNTNSGGGGGDRDGNATGTAGGTISTAPAVYRTFEDMGLKEDLLRGIYAYGYERPSAVQQRAIVPILQGRDVVAQAQSGTGKSSLIALCVCQLVDPRVRELSRFVFVLVSSCLASLCSLLAVSKRVSC